jgi:hypothetical protein
MRCLACGGELHLVHVVEDEAKTAGVYEKHTFECSSCHEVEHRPVFNERKRPIRRTVQIIQHPKYEGSLAAQDMKSGMIIMVHQDRERLRELCEWMGWRVVAASTRPSE